MLIGLDRPLKSQWIFELLNMVETGAKPSDYNAAFENVAVELTGKESIRKVRTIIFRSFIYAFQENKTRIASNELIDLSRSRDEDFMRPIYLAKIMFDYEICQLIVPKFQLYKNKNHEINLKLITKKTVEAYGDRDVVKRSVRSLIKSLSYFNVLSMIDSATVIQNQPMILVPEQWKYILKLYAGFYLKSKIIDINDINMDLFFYLSVDKGFHDTIKAYHGEEWEYIRDHSRNMLLMK